MKKLRLHKLLSLALCCIMCLATLVGCVIPPENGDDKHQCSQVCPDCGGCLDETCTKTECLPKCDCDEQGNQQGDDHVCSQPCPECGGCLDEACDKTECLPKCTKDHNTDVTEEDYSYRPVITSEMPIVYINTADGSNDFITVPNQNSKLNGEIEYVDATISIKDSDGSFALEDIASQVKARGNYTLNYVKKPIRIKFGKKQSVLGLNDGAKFKSWVLLADWKDLSMSNNTTALYLGNTILGSDGYYTTDYRNVEVYINNEYWGVYLLAEQQEAKSKDGRSSAPAVDDDYEGTDIGYLVEYDGYYDQEAKLPNGSGDPTFTINYNNYASLQKLNGSNLWSWQKGYTVKSDVYSDAQLTFIQRYMSNAYRIAYEAAYNNNLLAFNEDYTDVVATSGTVKDVIGAVIDLQSLVDSYILAEIACDPDIAWSSFYISLDMTKKGSHKLIFEAPWDFDSAFGIRNGYCNSATGMYAANSDNPWLILLAKQDWFWDMVQAKWAKLVDNNVLTTALELITLQKTTYVDYYAHNYERWSHRFSDSSVRGELTSELNSYTSQGQAADYLYRWLYKRFNYLNTQWGDGADILGKEYDDVPSTPGENSTPYRFEAEDCELDPSIKIDNWHSEWASGGLFIGELDGHYGLTITLTVYVEQDTTAFLSVGLSKRNYSADFSEWFTVSVNDDAPLDIPPRFIPSCNGYDVEWVAWTDVNLMPIELKAGVNTITFTTLSKATNVDYFELWATTPITATDPNA